jgi:hypothetical protein
LNDAFPNIPSIDFNHRRGTISSFPPASAGSFEKAARVKDITPMIGRSQPRPSRRPGTENDPPSHVNSNFSDVCHSTPEPKLNDNSNGTVLHVPGSLAAAEAPSNASNGLHRPQQDDGVLTSNSETTLVATRDIRLVVTREATSKDVKSSMFRSLANAGHGEVPSSSSETVNPSNLQPPLPESVSESNYHPHVLSLGSLKERNIEYSLTQPESSPRRPLVIPAKRHGNEVRRHNSKRRRQWRRRSSNRMSSPVAPKSDGNVHNIGDNGSFWLWKDDNDDIGDGGSDAEGSSSSAGSDNGMFDSSDDDEPYRNTLPFLFNAKDVSSNEANKQYWDWCYGNGATVELPLNAGAFSAARVPPLKGWYVASDALWIFQKFPKSCVCFLINVIA